MKSDMRMRHREVSDGINKFDSRAYEPSSRVPAHRVRRSQGDWMLNSAIKTTDGDSSRDSLTAAISKPLRIRRHSQVPANQAGTSSIQATDSNRNRRTGGTDGSSEAKTLADAEHKRNYAACLKGYGYCDASRLTDEEARTIHPSKTEREETFLLQELMIQRQCPHCSSELVRARRADQQSAPVIAHAASPGWRCSVCGLGFTTEQIRDSKRAKSAAR